MSDEGLDYSILSAMGSYSLGTSGLAIRLVPRDCNGPGLFSSGHAALRWQWDTRPKGGFLSALVEVAIATGKPVVSGCSFGGNYFFDASSRRRSEAQAAGTS